MLIEKCTDALLIGVGYTKELRYKLEDLMTYRKVRTVRSVILLYSLYSILYYASARPSSGHESHYITTTTTVLNQRLVL